jgi:hypothetical protein
MNREQFLNDPQQKQIRGNLLKKLVSNARAIISNEIGISVGCLKMIRIIAWLEPHEVILNYPVFEDYSEAIIAIPSGKERLNCSREALRRYDEQLLPINSQYHDRIIDACFGIMKTFGKVHENQKTENN